MNVAFLAFTFQPTEIHLDKCLSVQFRKGDHIALGKRIESRSVYLWDAEQIVQIGAISGTPKDVLARFALGDQVKSGHT